MHNTDSIHLHYIQAIISTSSAWVWSRSSLLLGWTGSAGPAGGTTICAGRGPGRGMRPQWPWPGWPPVTVSESVEDSSSSEYLQRVKFQSKSRDNTTASLRGKKLKLAKVEGRADGSGRRPPSESREDGTAPARRLGQAQRQNLKFYVQGPATWNLWL
jgi:hypothetical protein